MWLNTILNIIYNNDFNLKQLKILNKYEKYTIMCQRHSYFNTFKKNECLTGVIPILCLI